MRSMPSMRAGTGWLFTAAAALLAAWLVAPAAVPLYDGIGFPDEPYRFVEPPAGYRTTPPPTKAFGSVPAVTPDGRSANGQDLYAKSAEQGPQVEMYVSKGGLTGPAIARSYRISAVPVAPGRRTAAGPPAGGGPRIDGDVYRVTTGCSSLPSTNPGPVPAKANCRVKIIPNGSRRFAWIALRATSTRRPGPVFLYRPTPSATWQRLPTDRAGNDIYATTLRGDGDYALTFPAAAQSPGAKRSSPSSASGGPPTTVIVLVVVLACLAIGIGAIRFTRTRRQGRRPR
jgi:hypothetical protein